MSLQASQSKLCEETTIAMLVMNFLSLPSQYQSNSATSEVQTDLVVNSMTLVNAKRKRGARKLEKSSNRDQRVLTDLLDLHFQSSNQNPRAKRKSKRSDSNLEMTKKNESLRVLRCRQKRWLQQKRRTVACRASRCSSRLAHWVLSRSAAATRPGTHQGTRRHPRRVPSCIMHVPANAFLKG